VAELETICNLVVPSSCKNTSCTD